MATTAKPAPVKWAQRADLVYLNFQVQDVENPEVAVEKNKVVYKAVTKDKQKFETVLNLFGEVNIDESKWVNRDRGAEFVLIKSEPGFWKRLLQETTKYHWLTVDFNRWKDEDDSEDEAAGGAGGGTNFEEMMRQMGGLGGAGGPGGASPFNELDDLDVEDEKDSDDENIPDLEEGDKPADDKKE